jgi:hypothetical protein
MFHPDEWSAADRTAYYAWKRANYVEKWQFYRSLGLPRLMPRDHLQRRVRDDLDAVLAPPPSRVYQRCPCHSFRPVRTQPDPSPHGLAYIRSFDPLIRRVLEEGI